MILSVRILVMLLVAGPVFAQPPPPETGIRLMETVRLTVANQPDILLQEQQVEIQQGFLETETGKFDINLGLQASHERDDAPLAATEQQIVRDSSLLTETTAYRAYLQKLFRTGVTITPSVQNTITDYSPSSYDPTATGRVDFLITVPLQRGLGVEATGAGETAARLLHEASILQLRQTVALAVYGTVLSYWNYLATRETLDTLEDSEERARTILNQVQELVAGDEVPAGDLEQLRANLENKTGNRIATELQLLQAQQSLGLAMGIPFGDFRSLPLPADPFPDFDMASVEKMEASSDRLLQTSLSNRGDYLAAEKIRESANVQVTAARNALKYQLDLSLNLGYQGLEEDRGLRPVFTPLYRNVPGASASVLLQFLFPLENRAARGALRQSSASLQQTGIQMDDLIRKIQSGVHVALHALKSSALQLQRAREAISSYRLAVQNERDKFALGTATLLDIVNMEDKLTSALLSKVSAHAAYAAAIVELRLQTGTLVSGNQDFYTVNESELREIGGSEDR